MKLVDNNTAAPIAPYDGTPRRLNMTCRFCRHNWSTWTRRGLRAKCPNCGRLVEGPEKVRQLIEGVGRKAQPAVVTPIRIATDTASTAPAAAAKKATPARPGEPPRRRAAATKTTAAQPSAPPPPAAKSGGLGEAIFRGLGFTQ